MTSEELRLGAEEEAVRDWVEGHPEQRGSGVLRGEVCGNSVEWSVWSNQLGESANLMMNWFCQMVIVSILILLLLT